MTKVQNSKVKCKPKTCVLLNYYDLSGVIYLALQKTMSHQKHYHTVHFEPYKNGVKISFD